MISVTLLEAPSGDRLPVEIVERKGLGHPDSICDALVEALGLEVARTSLRTQGRVSHYNVDKALLCGGASRVDFGEGELIAPIDVYFAGRASLPTDLLDDLVERTARTWLESHIPEIRLGQHLHAHNLVRGGSRDLTALFDSRNGEQVPANDTSLGVGYAPLSRVERFVLDTEQRLSSMTFRREHPAIGSDIKIMAVRTGRALDVTVACAFRAEHVASAERYETLKARLRTEVTRLSREAGFEDTEVSVNGADRPDQGSAYLTVLGTSAEAGDDGEAGRGNRVNGLITPFRPMTMESPFGKNAVSHVGRIYNVAAGQIADRVVCALSVVEEAHCFLVSRIGSPIAKPPLVNIALRTVNGLIDAPTIAAVDEIATNMLARLGDINDGLLKGNIRIGQWPFGPRT